MTQRNLPIDVAKGIGVLCMVAGHTFTYSQYPTVCSMIFIWNMPLFFVLSGYFYNSDRFYSARTAMALLKPYITTGLVIVFICALKSLVTGDIYEKTSHELAAVLWGWGAEPMRHGIYPIPAEFPTIGPIWFLLALMWCRLGYHLIRKTFSNVFMVHLLVLCSSILSLVVSHYISVPLSILQGVHSILYFHIGCCVRHYDVKISKMGGGILSYSCSHTIWY